MSGEHLAAASEYVDVPLNTACLQPWSEIDENNVAALGVMATCGSYNPIHNMHIEMFEGAKKRMSDVHPDITIVGGFLSPVNDAYGKPGLLDFSSRAELCEGALEGHPWIGVERWEGSQKTYMRSFIVLTHIVNATREHYLVTATNDRQRSLAESLRMYFVCGGDLFETFYRPRCWKLVLLEKIFVEFHLCVIARVGSQDPVDVMKTRTEPLTSPDEPGIAVDLSKYTDKVTVATIAPNAASSTLVRQRLKAGEEVGDLVPARAAEILRVRKLYVD